MPLLEKQHRHLALRSGLQRDTDALRPTSIRQGDADAMNLPWGHVWVGNNAFAHGLLEKLIDDPSCRILGHPAAQNNQCRQYAPRKAAARKTLRQALRCGKTDMRSRIEQPETGQISMQRIASTHRIANHMIAHLRGHGRKAFGQGMVQSEWIALCLLDQFGEEPFKQGFAFGGIGRTSPIL